MAQPFGSAFASAGRLATRLAKGLVPGTNTAQPQRTEKGPVERDEEGKGAPQSQEGAPQPGEAGSKNPFVAAFKALKRSRLFRFSRLRKKRAERGEGITPLLYGDDYDEEEHDEHRARAWLGQDQEDTTFEHAKREALLLRLLESQGEPPLRIVRQLNFQLSVRPDREFKHLLCDEVRPLMDVLAGRVEQLAAEERRALAAMISRAAYQVGIRSAANFSQLLGAAGAAEAAQLEASSAPLVERAAHLERALRRAASPEYRTALLQAGLGFLEKLAGEMAGLAPQERHLVWVSLLRASESVEPGSLSLMAHAVVAGVLGGGTGNTGRIAEALGPALRTVPGGGSWAVQLVFVLSARGEAQAAEQLAEVLRGVIQEARAACIPTFRSLLVLRTYVSAGAGNEDELLRELEARAPLLVALMPTCAQVLEKANAMPPAASALGDEALLALGALDQVGTTAAGQRMLRRTLLAQERGSQTFLTALPKVASTLAQPQWAPSLGAAGLVAANYQAGGQLFLQRAATQTGLALTGPVLARSQKGDSPSARVLLRSAIRNNAVLFGLKPEGARLAADVLEALRDKPGVVSLQRTQVLLQKIRWQHAVSKHFTSVETLQVVANALAQRGMAPSQQATGPGRREPPRLTALEIAVDQSVYTRQKASAPAPAREPKPPPRAAPRSRK